MEKKKNINFKETQKIVQNITVYNMAQLCRAFTQSNNVKTDY